MNEIRTVIARNIACLRAAHGMTQADLAEKLNYSDKAVSKWERGESVPDIVVLTQIADLFHISLDALVREVQSPAHAEDTFGNEDGIGDPKKRPHAIITCLGILLIWMIATLIFVIFDILPFSVHEHWMTFICAIPLSMIVWLVFNSIWFDRQRNYLIISLLMWTLFGTIYLVLFALKINIWQIFLLGIPGQTIIILWSNLTSKKTWPPARKRKSQAKENS